MHGHLGGSNGEIYSTLSADGIFDVVRLSVSLIPEVAQCSTFGLVADDVDCSLSHLAVDIVFPYQAFQRIGTAVVVIIRRQREIHLVLVEYGNPESIAAVSVSLVIVSVPRIVLCKDQIVIVSGIGVTDSLEPCNLVGYLASGLAGGILAFRPPSSKATPASSPHRR